MPSSSCSCLLIALLISAAAQAAEFGDKRDKPGEVQQLRVPHELIPPSPARSAEEEMKTFDLASGFRLELVAADPLVQDPVAMQIGPDGRLWVVEMRGFMADLDGIKEAEPVGDVVVLEDTDGDGRMDKRTVFLDGLVMPRALMLAGDGVLVGAPPHLWFCRDTNGDGKADEKIEVASNFGRESDPVRPEVANPEQEPNSLLWASDNWIYAAHHTRRYRFDGKTWSSDVATFRGQWGLTQDNDGHFFYNSNQDPLRVDLIPAQYAGRNPGLVPCGGVNVQVYTDQLVWPVRVNPGVNRGYRDGILRENYRLKEFTAACAPCIYRGGLFPSEFDGNAFICEPAGNLIKREIITSANGTLTCKEAYHEREFLASTDERFRPVNLYNGPGGALYVVDFYRGVLQHRESFTTYLRKYIEERGLTQPQHLGRIYRIVPEKASASPRPQLDKETPEQWVAHLSDAASWQRETAQRLLVERKDTATVPLLRKLATQGSAPLGRSHALWTLDGMQQMDVETAAAALHDPEPRVRDTAIRVCEPFLGGARRAEVLGKLLAMRAERSPFVQQQLVLTLSVAADEAADLAMAEMVKQNPATEYLADAAVSGLGGRELPLLRKLLAAPEWSQPDEKASAFLGALARCIFITREPSRVESLLGLIAQKGTKALIEGVLQTKPVTKRKPVKLKAEPVALRGSKGLESINELITWPGKPGAKPEPPVIPLTAAQQQRFELGKALFAVICAACHQPHGMGMEGVAPPLVDSEWVLGSEQRLVRILLNGISGPLSVKGRSYRLDMPPLGVFTDDQVAGILTYIRREWEHNASPVEPETVKTIRAATADRHDAWLQDDLKKIP